MIVRLIFDYFVLFRRMPRIAVSEFFLKFVLLTAFSVAMTGEIYAQSATNQQIYWGAWAGGSQYGKTDAPFDMTTLDRFETNAGKKVSIVRWGQPWRFRGVFQNFPTTSMNAVRSHGSIPLLDWGSWGRGNGESQTNQPDFQNGDVANGTYDSYIRQWADQAAAWGYPFFLRYNFELNGWWYSFHEGRDNAGNIVNGNHVGDYIRSWKHVWNVFNCVDDGVFHPVAGCKPVRNATWTWTINIISTAVASNGLPRYAPLSQTYPGSQYVDWVGVSLYNKNSTTLPFAVLFTGQGTNWLRNTYQELASIAPGKPMMLAEYASFEYNRDGTIMDPAVTTNWDPTIKASWITDAIGTQIMRNFPLVKAAVWYNTVDVTGTGYIETSIQSTAAFKNAIASNYYAVNSFGNLHRDTKVLPIGVIPEPSQTPTASIPSPSPASRPGDANGDGRIDGQDFFVWLTFYGQPTANRASDGDFNGSGYVDGSDYFIWLANYGT
jgi:hypothetical protein